MLSWDKKTLLLYSYATLKRSQVMHYVTVFLVGGDGGRRCLGYRQEGVECSVRVFVIYEVYLQLIIRFKLPTTFREYDIKPQTP